MFDELNQLKRFFSTMEISEDEKKKRCDLAYAFYDAIYFVFALIKVEKEVEERNFTRNALIAEQYRDTLEKEITDALKTKGLIYEPEYVNKLVDDVIHNRPVFKDIDDKKIADIVKQAVKEAKPGSDYKDTLQSRLSDAFKENDIQPDNGYVKQLVADLIDTTNRHPDDPYYLSKDRAVLIAQNEANTVYNHVDYVTAKESGKKYKRWNAELDDRTREAHAQADGTVVPIDDFFYVGGDTLRYPHDYVNGSAENLINCRCICTYE